MLMLDAALQYIARGWRVFPLHTTISGTCSCGKVCGKNAGKHPRTRNGVKDATTDRATVERWWTRNPDSNIGVATGSGLVVVDLDSAAQIEQFRDLALASGGMPACPVSQTGRGAHFWFSGQLQGSKTVQGILIRGEGGYVVAPPSLHQSGQYYKWVRETTLPGIPGWLHTFINLSPQGNEKSTHNAGNEWDHGLGALGPKPDYLKRINGHDFNHAARAAQTPLNAIELSRINSALSAIPPSCDRQTWLQIGMALQSLGWETPEGDQGFSIWNNWSSYCPEKYSLHDCEVVWRSFRGSGVSIGTLFHIAGLWGWRTVTVPPAHAGTPHESGTQNASPPGPDLFTASQQAAAQQLNPIDILNTSYCVIGDLGGKCVVMGQAPSHTDQTIRVPSFQSFTNFANRFDNKYIGVADEHGDIKQKPLGSYWLRHGARRTFDFLDFVPGGPAVLPPNTLNLWTGFGVEPRAGPWPLMQDHIATILAAGDPASIRYILKWAAWAVQNPGRRAEAALVLCGGKRSGKGTFGHAMRRIFGSHGLHISNPKHMVGSFNAHMRSCCLLFADEAFWAGDKQGESTLKSMLTEPTLLIEQKGFDVTQVRNCLHIIMAANAEWVVPASHDEARYAVFEVSDDRQHDSPYFEALYAELDSGGIEAMLHDLLRVDLRGWHPRDIPQTRALLGQKQHSLSVLQEWFQEILSTGAIPYADKSAPDTSGAVFLFNHAKEFSNKLRDLNPNRLGRFLKKMGCVPVHRTNNRFWKFPPITEARAMWVKRYGLEWERELGSWE